MADQPSLATAAQDAAYVQMETLAVELERGLGSTPQPDRQQVSMSKDEPEPENRDLLPRANTTPANSTPSNGQAHADATARPPRKNLRHRSPLDAVEASTHRQIGPTGSAAVIALTDSVAPVASSVDREQLRQAMQAAATHASASSAGVVAPPLVRVDPQEKNLDRAFARAFAWAFAVDRSFFTSAPVGRARFVLELAEDGRIAKTHWLEPRPTVRMRELVARMVKLLSTNRFRLVDAAEDAPRRAFEMRITELQVRKSQAPNEQQGLVGDLWMLGAGETPTPGHPSHPAVADASGHQIDCELRIVVPTPLIP